jgi:hypothetical protein
MRAVIEVISGPATGKKLSLRPGQIGQVGRTSWADLSLPGDASLSAMHFAVECSGQGCQLRDLGGVGGTRVNGQQVSEAWLKEGDRIVAGSTTFLVRLEGTAAPPATPPPATVQGASLPPPPTPVAPAGAAIDLLQLLQTQPEPLFALVDAARGDAVREWLAECSDPHQSLYEGERAEALADFAPYLVSFAADSAALETLVAAGWGKAWGVYLAAPQPFAEVRKHFRRFLMVELDDEGPVYFRYYDPRVLRLFLPACTAEEAAQFFGPVMRFWVEGDPPETMLTFTPGPGGVRCEPARLAARRDESLAPR